MNNDVLDVNAVTGEEVLRPKTEEEIVNYQKALEMIALRSVE